MNTIKAIAFITLCFLSVTSNAQIKKPSLSPKIVTQQQVGLANFTLEYGQPNTQGRTVFGALIPYNKLWRTGANASTKITIDREVTFAGTPIPAGTYGLYSIPTEKEWTIILSKNSKLWGAGGYNETEDFVRFKVPSIPLEDAVETFTIHFENFNTNGGDLIIAWENTKINIPVYVDSDKAIFEEIEAKITNATEDITAATYFDAAQFYYLKNKQLDKAVTWFDKAIEMRPNAFWYVYYRGELALQLKDTKTAKVYATRCLEAAKKSTSSDYGYIAKATLLLEKIEGTGK
ncbi:MAG: tetratricopeptide (TPR) repeat protein [Dokdonia sp.]|jgi:tetratricopeptide (TPR) repeat protein